MTRASSDLHVVQKINNNQHAATVTVSSRLPLMPKDTVALESHPGTPSLIMLSGLA